jgi:hypothetical protein
MMLILRIHCIGFATTSQSHLEKAGTSVDAEPPETAVPRVRLAMLMVGIVSL